MSLTLNEQFQHAANNWEVWNDLGVSGRATILHSFAKQLSGTDARMANWQIANAEQHIAETLLMPGPTGEANELFTAGRGIFVCHADTTSSTTAIVGQLVAALIAGNVILMSGDHPALENLHQQLINAGCADAVAQRLPANAVLDSELINQPLLAGIVYSGDTTQVLPLNQALAARDGNLAQLIVETDAVKLPTIGSPYYLLRFITERTRSDNTTAVGGNATLLELGGKEE